MKTIAALALTVTLGASSPVLLAADAAEAQAECAQMAKEDGVPEEEMEQYMAACLADLQGNGEIAPPDDAMPDDSSPQGGGAPRD